MRECPYIIDKPEPRVLLIELGDFAKDFRMYGWVGDYTDEFVARDWLLKNVDENFKREGIDIPYPTAVEIATQSTPSVNTHRKKTSVRMARMQMIKEDKQLAKERASAKEEIEEIAERLKIIGIVVGLLVVAELFYRWLTYPNDSFAIYQELLTWAWYHTHSLIFGAESVSYVTTDGPATILQFTHESFVGSSMDSLEVTDECAGIHEIAFVSFMIWMTPGVSKHLKL